jgi:hypothetical protein
MQSYAFDFVPGPSPVLSDILAVYTRNYSSPDILDSFFERYCNAQQNLAKALSVGDGTVTIQSGEGMLGRSWSVFFLLAKRFGEH